MGDLQLNLSRPGPDHGACLRLRPPARVRARPRRPGRDAAGHQAADRGRRPVEDDARRPAPLRRAQDRRVGRGAGEALEARPVVRGRPTRNRSRPTASRSAKIIGVVDPRLPATMERFGDDDGPALVAEDDAFRVYQVRWPVLEGVHGEGLLLEPKGEVRGHVIALPDADQTPEQVAGLGPGVAPGSQFARRLAANGFRVVVPTLISRGIDFSGQPADRDDQPAAPRVDLPAGVPDGPARHRLRGAEGAGRRGLDQGTGRGRGRRSALPATARAA